MYDSNLLSTSSGSTSFTDSLGILGIIAIVVIVSVLIINIYVLVKFIAMADDVQAIRILLIQQSEHRAKQQKGNEIG